MVEFDALLGYAIKVWGVINACAITRYSEANVSKCSAIVQSLGDGAELFISNVDIG